MSTAGTNYQVMLAANDEVVETVQSELAKLHVGKVAGSIPAREHLGQVWETSTLNWRRKVIALVVKRIVVHPGHPGSHLWNGHRFDPNQITIDWSA